MKKRCWIIILACILLAGCAQSKYDSLSDASSSSVSSISTVHEPTRYEKMKTEIELYLLRHNDTSKVYDSVEVTSGTSGTQFHITLEAYETYTFAAVTSAATDIIRELIDEYEIEEYELWVTSPTDAKYTISWISTDLDVGVVTDNGYKGKYNETCTLDYMLAHYDYEDYEGKLIDFLKEKNSTPSEEATEEVTNEVLLTSEPETAVEEEILGAPVRSSPGLQYNIRSVIPFGKEIEVEEYYTFSDIDWVYLELEGKHAYIEAKYFKPISGNYGVIVNPE